MVVEGMTSLITAVSIVSFMYVFNFSGISLLIPFSYFIIDANLTYLRSH